MLPLAVFAAHWGLLGAPPLYAAVSGGLLLPALVDAPPRGQLQQGYAYSYGLG